MKRREIKYHCSTNIFDCRVRVQARSGTAEKQTITSSVCVKSSLAAAAEEGFLHPQLFLGFYATLGEEGSKIGREKTGKTERKRSLN